MYLQYLMYRKFTHKICDSKKTQDEKADARRHAMIWCDINTIPPGQALHGGCMVMSTPPAPRVNKQWKSGFLVAWGEGRLVGCEKTTIDDIGILKRGHLIQILLCWGNQDFMDLDILMTFDDSPNDLAPIVSTRWFHIFFTLWGNDPIWWAYFSNGLKLNHQLAAESASWAASSRPSPIFPKPNFEVAEIVVEISEEMTGKRREIGWKNFTWDLGWT